MYISLISRKKNKVIFLVARPLKSPPPLELKGHIFWEDSLLGLQKKFFVLSFLALTVPLLGAGTLKNNFFAASLTN